MTGLDRRGFLRLLGVGAVAAPVARHLPAAEPMVLAGPEPEMVTATIRTIAGQQTISAAAMSGFVLPQFLLSDMTHIGLADTPRHFDDWEDVDGYWDDDE